MKTITAGGVDIPALGLGVWQVLGPDCVRMVRYALDIGYRHIDTAFVYRNEPEVGEALRQTSVAREDIFLTTKVWRDQIGAGDLQRAAEDSLKRLGQDYVDLLLIHWPNAEIPLEESIGALCEVKRRGLARSIGLSNFPSALFDEAAELSSEPLVTNQVEYHPYLTQNRLLGTVRRHGATLTAYSPLAQGAVADDPVLKRIGEAHDATAAQVTLRWLVQQDGVIAVPRSAREARARENFDIWRFELSEAEMAAIFALARPDGRLPGPPFPVPVWDKD